MSAAPSWPPTRGDLGSPGDLGGDPSARPLHREDRTASADPRRSGALHPAGADARDSAARQIALPAPGTRQPAHSGPGERQGCPGERPGARLPRNYNAGVCPGRATPGIPRRDRSARRGTSPGDLSRPGRSALCALPLPTGTRRHHARGRRPHAQSRDWAPVVFSALWLPPGIATPAVSGPSVRTHRRPLPTSPKIAPLQPQPTTCQCTPHPSLDMEAPDAGERPTPSPVLSSRYLLFQCSPPNYLKSLVLHQVIRS